MKSRPPKLTDADHDKMTAVHEAGHAVMAAHFVFPFGSVSTESDGVVAGFVRTTAEHKFTTQHPDDLFGLEKEVIILMAGVEAVKANLPELAAASQGDSGDVEQIKIRVNDLCLYTEETQSSAKRRLRNMTRWYMAEHAIRSAVVDVANELLRKKTLGKEGAQKFVEQVLRKYHRKYFSTK